MKDWMTKEEIFEEFFEELNGIEINEKELDDIFFEFLDIAIAIDAGYLLNNFVIKSFPSINLFNIYN